MSYRLADVIHENPTHWVYRVAPHHFEVYRKGTTHSTRVHSVINSANPEKARASAIQVCDARDLATIKP